MTNIEDLFIFEGEPLLDGKTYPDDKIEAIVDSFFVDGEKKSPPANRGDATVKILLGAPGSGKSYNAAEDYFALDDQTKSQTVYVSYDETGAIYAIPEFRKDMEDLLGDFDEHGEIDFEALSPEQYSDVEGVWTKYRALSQHIRSKILKRAAAEGFNLVIDTTSSSPGSLKMIEAITKAGYKKENIEVEGTYAPIEISRSRVEKRPRKASYLELITKRIGDPEEGKGAINMLKPLISAVGKLTYRYNPDNENPPQEAFVFEGGQLSRSNATAVQQIQQSSVADTAYIHEFLPMIREGFPQFREGLGGYEDFAVQTDRNFRTFLTNSVLGNPAPQRGWNGPA